jgi:hypothetical protein
MTAKIPALRQSTVGACAQNNYYSVSAHVTSGAGLGSFLEVYDITFRGKVAVSVELSLRQEGHARLWQGF